MGADILVVAEHLEGKLAPATLEIVAKGRELAAQAGGPAQAGPLRPRPAAPASELASYGLDVLMGDDPALEAYSGGGYAQALASMLAASPPRVLLLAHTAQGYDLAPALAAA